MSVVSRMIVILPLPAISSSVRDIERLLRESPSFFRAGRMSNIHHFLVQPGRHGIDAGANRAVTADAGAHRGDVIGPWHAEKSRIVHEQLSIRAQDVDQSDISRLERTALLAAEIVAVEDSRQIGAALPLQIAVAIDVEQELLQLI